MGRKLFFEELLKLLQFFLVNVRNSPVVQVRFYPVQKLITLARYCLRSSGFVGRCRPNKQVNKMFASLVNQRSHRPIIEIIKTSPNQGKSVAGKVDHCRCKIELGVQPGLYGMLVGGSNVREVVRHKRAHMTGDKLRGEKLIIAWSLQSGQYVPDDNGCKNDGSGES